MSLPPAPMALPTAMISPAVINPLEQALLAFNTNPYFIGLMMLLLNLGGRFIGMEVSKEQEKFFQHPWVRRALIFTVLFVATRNVFVAFIMTILVLLVVSFLFNENSNLCLWKREDISVDASKDSAGAQPQGALTPEETEIWRRLNEKQIRLSAGMKKENTPETKEDEAPEPSIEETYFTNLMRLR
jgi:hypothetical protein